MHYLNEFMVQTIRRNWRELGRRIEEATVCEDYLLAHDLALEREMLTQLTLYVQGYALYVYPRSTGRRQAARAAIEPRHAA